MADLAEIAQSGIDPVTGSPLSAERRKAIFRRAQISSSSVFGNRGGGAIVPVSKGPDPQTLAIVSTNSGAITALQKQVTSLTQQNNNVIVNLGKVGALEKQVEILQVKIVDLGSNLQQIANLLNAESELEKQKERLVVEQEKRAAELGLRRGKENLLEKKIQEALLWPVKQIGSKIQFGFDTLMNFMWTLLGGWLTIQGLNVLQSLAKGDKKKLDDIKNNVIKSLLVVGGILSILSIGIFRVIGSIAKLTFRLGKFLLTNTIGKLFGGVFNMAKNALGFGAKPAAAAASASTTAARITMGAGTAEEIAKAAGKTGTAAAEGGNLFSKLGNVFKFGAAEGGAEVATKGFGLAGRAMPLIGTGIDVGMGIGEALRGNWTGAAMYGGAAGLSLIPGAQGFSLATSLAATGQSLLYNPKDASKKDQKTSDKSKISPSSLKLKEPKKSSPPPESDKPQISSEPSTPQIISEQPQAQTSSEPSTPQITPAQMSKPSTVPFNISTTPERKPNIVYLNSGNKNQNPTPQTSLDDGIATDVPLIASSDSDNFYTLYAQVNYNVII